MRKWEYKQIQRELDLTDVDYFAVGPGLGPEYEWTDSGSEEQKFWGEMRFLSRMGEEGWELVSVLYKEAGRKHTYTYYLKRPIE
jgi:hypothetical protein